MANVTLEYDPPGTGAKIRDAAGNGAAEIARADALDVTVTPDTRAPEVSGIPTVDGATLVVTFDEALDTASIPAAPGGLTLTVSRSGGSVTAPTVSGLSLPSSWHGADADALAGGARRRRGDAGLCQAVDAAPGPGDDTQ